MVLFVLLLFLAWIYVMTVLYRAKTGFWYYLVGSVGFFAFSMYFIEPAAVAFLQKNVATVAGLIGSVTGIFDSYFKSGILFISHNGTNLSMFIDYECSGVIEIFAFISLLAFFRIYEVYERVVVAFIGTLIIFVSNVLRIVVICVAVYFGGLNWYFIAHTVIGRLFFYACTVLLYFYVFTKPQIIRQSLGGFKYEHSK